MRRRWLHLILGLIALLMLADFIFRGIAPALGREKNDFTEVYVGAWLWRHGGNFYDAALTTATGSQLAGTQVNIVLVYPPSALVMISPFTFLSWKVANLLWLVLELAAIALTVTLLINLAGLHRWEDQALIFGTFFLAFDPVHQAFHLGNVALIVAPLCLTAINLAEKKQDFVAGMLLSAATALKPQLGLWVLLFYFLHLRKRLMAGALLVALGLALAMVRYPVPMSALISGYRNNLAYWFAPGRRYGFTEAALPFHVNNSQVIFYQLLHNAWAANWLAYSLFFAGLILWGIAVRRSRNDVSVPLALSSLLALSFISTYHSVSDVVVLTLALCWALRGDWAKMEWSKRLTCGIFLLLMLPGHSGLMRVTPYLSPGVAEAWWWKLVVARYFVWLLLALNGVLLYSLLTSRPRQLRTP